MEISNSSDFSDRRNSSDELLTDPLPISAESEIVPNLLKEAPKEHKAGFFRGLKFNRKEGELIPLSRKHSIIIKCQKPSIEEQTPV
ncbi:hypothetical protein Avbf_10442 [Armadillidium vulgare]|nr:hypothetical protein Avbf_10442 [Armadillidium vulgare]